MLDLQRYRVPAGGARRRLQLDAIPSDDDGGLTPAAGRRGRAALGQRLATLQELLYAEGRRALLVVIQGMDTSGKDTAIRSVFAPVGPQGCVVASFKAPSRDELDRDFLWRVHARVPPRGHIGVFNRSHYEDVLIVRVKTLVPRPLWERRYEHINAFEKLLADEGTSVLKFYLHISKDYQKKRLQRRLRRPEKHWKFNPDDLAERARWDDYRRAYEAALSRCSTAAAPWYVVPAEKRWFRDLLISAAVVERLESLGMKYPPANFDPAKIVVE